MQDGERITILETKMDYVGHDIKELNKRVGHLEDDTKYIIGKLETIETFLLSPKEPFLTNLSENVWKITKIGSFTAFVLAVGWFIIMEILPKFL